MRPRASYAVACEPRLHYIARAEDALAAQPNIGLLHRMIYVAAGLALMWLGFTAVQTPWLRVAMPIGGAILLIQGFIGWCGTVALLRRGAVANRK